jgi:hypothetical protein
MELYNNVLAKHKITGIYIIKGDTTIIFSYKNENGYSRVLMYGNLNKTMNFVDGFGRPGCTQKGVFTYKNKGKSSFDRAIYPTFKKEIVMWF